MTGAGGKGDSTEEPGQGSSGHGEDVGISLQVGRKVPGNGSLG